MDFSGYGPAGPGSPRIVITGASGFVGRQIIPLLLDAGAELLLVGRDLQRLEILFPATGRTGYENLARDGAGYDMLVHLAVMNNDQKGELSDFRAANVILLRKVVDSALEAGIPAFVNMASLHADGRHRFDNYSRTKAEAEEFLSGVRGIRVINLRLPAVHGTSLAGRLAMINSFPSSVRPVVFSLLAAMKPTVEAGHVAGAILACLDDSFPGEMIISDRQMKNGIYGFFQRSIDLGFCLAVIFLFWWLFAIVWLAIRFSSDGGAIFSQQRVGKNGKIFECYKFRTMYKGTRQAATHEIDVGAVTPVGRFLRRTKLDELPQVINILRNEMSLVGPRPCLPSQKQLIKERRKLGVLDVNCGITGLSQIRGIDMSDARLLARMDARYVALRTIPLDLKIILSTVAGGGQGDRVGG